MKTIFLFISCLFVGSAFGTPGIHEALKNPASVSVLQLNGTANEANLFTKNVSRFTALQQIIISGISDSVQAEQDLIAVASCPSVKKLSIDHCGFAHLSGALKMLVSVNDLEISNCRNLEISSAFSAVSEMPSLKTISYSTDKLVRIPRSFIRMRGLEKISIQNTDLSLADGYALNNSGPESLSAKESLQLGFGNSTLVLEYTCYDKTYAKEHINVMRDMLQGANGVNGEMTLPQQQIAFNRNHPLVKAPIPGLEVHKNIYSTDASKGGVLEYPSGTEISIPENAFVDKDGNSVKGNVTIDYREFRDPVDIMVSGIPMDYDSGGVKGHFVSAGMFEMNASVNGQEVFLAPGKNVSMKFAVVDTASDFNFYRLDEKKGWVYENSPGKVDNAPAAGQLADVGQVADFSFAVKTFYDWSQKKSQWAASLRGTKYDTLDFDSRYDDNNYSYTSKKERVGLIFRRDYSYYDNAFRLQKTYHHKGTVCFRVVRMNRSHNDPEIGAFSGVQWETNDAINRSEIKQLFKEKSGINDMRIYDDGSGFILEFKTKKGKTQIHAVPSYLQQGKPVEYKEKSQASMFKRYSKVLNKRRITFNEEVENNKNNLDKRDEDTDMKLDSVSYWNKIKPKMTSKEKSMDYQNWLGYYKKQLPVLIKQEQPTDFAYIQVTEGSSGAGQVQAEALYQELKVSGFGIYNCDHCGALPAPIAMNAQFDVKGMTEPNASNVYVIDRDINTSTNFFNRGGNLVNITYNGGSKTSLIIIGTDGKLYYTDSDSFQAGTKMNNGNTRYPATMITDQPASPQQIRDLVLAKK